MKNLVLTSSIGLKSRDLKRFVSSFRKYNQEDDLVIVTSLHDSKKLKPELSSYNVKYAVFESHHAMKTSINNSRYHKYIEFLSDTNVEYDKILLSDGRDVFFQENPFDVVEENHIYFIKEEDCVTIGQEHYNSTWIKQCYTKKIYYQLKHFNIICSGIVVGNKKNILLYIKNMLYKINKVLNSREQNRFLDVFDQGITNYIIYKNPDIFNNLSVLENGNLALHCALTLKHKPDYIQLKNGYIYYGETIPSIVHQFTSSKEMIKYVDDIIKSY